jgi:hypothetical protein
MELLLLLAHGGHAHEGNYAALLPIMLAALIVPLIVLAVVGRAFYRSSKRDGEASPPTG